MVEFFCVCGKKFQNKYSLDRHLKGKTNKCKLQMPKLKCNVSQSHEITSTTTYPCKYCNKFYSRKYTRDRHENNNCSNKNNAHAINEFVLENPEARIISGNVKAAMKHLVYSYSKATNKNISELILENHLEEYFIDDLQKIENNENNINSVNVIIKEEDKHDEHYNFKNIKNIFDDLEDTNSFQSNNLEELKIISPLDKSTLQKYEPIITETPSSQSSKTSNASITNINNANNSGSTNTNNTNHGTIINNNIHIVSTHNFNNTNKSNIPFVYPFGYENINFLKQEEMLEILKSVKGSEAVVDKIYSHISNQNFINQNQKKFMITVIDKDNKINPIIRYYKLEDFGMKLYQNSIELLMRIYHKCHTRLSVEHQLIILSNIKNIEEQLLNCNMHYDTYDTIITGISNNGMRRRYFIELKRKLEEEDPETTRKIKEILESQFEELAKYHEDLSKRALTKEKIHQLVWEPAEDIPEMDLDYHSNDLRLHRVIETPRYHKRKALEQSEVELIKQHGGCMGDVQTIYNLQQFRDQNEATLLKESYELNPEHLEEINLVFSNKPNNMIKLQTVRLARKTKPLLGTANEKRIL